ESKIIIYKRQEDASVLALQKEQYKQIPTKPIKKEKEINTFDYDTNSNDGIPQSLKNKLYFWIVDMNLIKENAIRTDDLPAICCNGVLIADIINRLEGV